MYNEDRDTHSFFVQSELRRLCRVFVYIHLAIACHNDVNFKSCVYLAVNSLSVWLTIFFSDKSCRYEANYTVLYIHIVLETKVVPNVLQLTETANPIDCPKITAPE